MDTGQAKITQTYNKEHKTHKVKANEQPRLLLKQDKCINK